MIQTTDVFKGQVRTSLLRPDGLLPLVVEPSLPGLDLNSWAQANRDALENRLLKHGGILFRGFGLEGSPDLQAFIRAFSGQPLEYKEQSSPRTAVGGNIYTSTDYPPEESIAMHCENSYQKTWPLRIFFLCAVPADKGGQTPIADVRRVYQGIDPENRRLLEEKKVMYVRNFGGGLGLPWQRVFQTDDRSEVDAHCRANGISFEWFGDQLRTRTVREPVKKHPRTGEPVWFNHAMFFHISTLREEIRETLRELYGPEELPANSLYGDGTEIPDSIIEQIRSVYERENVIFDWQKGDLLVLDNMLAAHGRRPFEGARRVLVGMSEPVSL